MTITIIHVGFRYKPILDQAIKISGADIKKCIIYERHNLPEVPTMVPGRDVSWDEALSGNRSHDCVPVEANDPLYVLYTSGTTGEYKLFSLQFLRSQRF